MQSGQPPSGFGPTEGRTWYWIAGALVCYLLAGVVLVFVLVSLVDPEQGFSLAALTEIHAAFLAIGTVLFAAGGYCARKAQSKIEFQGDQEDTVLPEEFNVLRPPDERGEGGEEDYEGPTTAAEAEAARDTETIVCPACGAENDPDFTYCENCAAELSE
jgi:ribosomal protein L40E